MDQVLWGELVAFMPIPLNMSHRPQESRPWNNWSLLFASRSALEVASRPFLASLKWYDGVKCALPGTGKALCFKATLILQRRVNRIRIACMDSVPCINMHLNDQPA